MSLWPFLVGVLVLLVVSGCSPEELACTRGEGTWAYLPDTCVDACHSSGCGFAFTQGCDCGPDKCWDGERCTPNPIIEEESPLPEQKIPATSFDLPVCEKDSDCTAVDDGCCGCSGGGKARAINRQYIKSWEDQILNDCDGITCTAVMSTDASCFSQARCINRQCTLVPDRKDLCDVSEQDRNVLCALTATLEEEKFFYRSYGIECKYAYVFCKGIERLTLPLPDYNQLECERVNGTMREFPNGCVDLCQDPGEPLMQCTEAYTTGCDCGIDRCWNGRTCQNNSYREQPFS